MLVYISATLLDLRPHRLAAERAVLTLGHQPLGMESYVAEDHRPLDVCLRDVARSDLYVGIFAWRYGSVADTSSSDTGDLGHLDVPEGASVTEYEFAQATALGKPRLLFLAAEDEPWSPRSIDAFTGAGDAGRRINELRAKALRSQVAFFRSPDSLASALSAALSRVELTTRVQEGALGSSGALQVALQGVPNAPLVTLPAAPGQAPVGDSRLDSIRTAVLESESGGVVQVDLAPPGWWVTRLYLLAALSDRFADDQQLLFRDEKCTFLGLTSAKAARQCLATLHPALTDFDRSLDTMDVPPNVDSAVARVLQAWELLMNQRGGELAIGGGVRRQDVRRWLADRMQTRHVLVTDTELPDRTMRRLLEWPTRFVPVEYHGDLMVSDRSVLAEHIAALALKELRASPATEAAAVRVPS